MHLLFYSPQFLPSIGGLQNVVHYWANAITEMGHEVTVLTHTPQCRKDEYMYRVVRNPGRKKEWELMLDCDKVLMFNVSLKALPQWILSGKPLFLSHHTALGYPGKPLPWQQRMKRWVANYAAKGNIACSAFIAAEYKNCQIVHSPYDASTYYQWQQLKPPGSIIAVGRLVSDKGIDTLVEAFGLLVQKNQMALRLTIVGDGPDRKLLEDGVDRKGLKSLVNFTGSLPAGEVAALLNHHELMVVPSRMEPFGIVVLEGLACGCKMVVSNQGGLPEAAGGLATLFPPDDPPALAAAIQHSLQQKRAFSCEAIAHHLAANNIESTARQVLEWIGR